MRRAYCENNLNYKNCYDYIIKKKKLLLGKLCVNDFSLGVVITVVTTVVVFIVVFAAAAVAELKFQC